MQRHILTVDRPSTGGDGLGCHVGEGEQASGPGGGLRPVENPAVRAFHAMAVARTVGVAARVGVFGELADGPSSVLELASRLRLQPEPLRLMLDLLVGEGLLDYCRPHYAMSVGARRWLDPESATSVNTFLSRTLDYWDWWADLEPIVTGQLPAPGAAPAADDERAWLRTTRGDYEIARLVADELASAITVPESARSVLDLGGGHGWFAAALCKRHPNLRATVIDHPGAVAIGQEIMWETEMDRVVTHQAGDLHTAVLGGPHDVVLCLPMMFDLSEEKTAHLLGRIRAALRRGGVLAIVKARGPDDAEPTTAMGSGAALKLLVSVRSGGESLPPGRFAARVAAAGFGPPRSAVLPSVPALSVQVATAI